MTYTLIESIPNQKLETMYFTSLNHRVVCSMVVKITGLVCMTLIPLDDYAPMIDIVTFGMHMP